MNEIMQIAGLKKVFRKKRNKIKALSNLDLNIERGDFISLQGPSGSGKTTLLNLMGCLDKPTSGKIVLDGIDTSKLGDNDLAKIRRDKIGFIFQSFNLIPILNAQENVELPMENTKLTRAQRREKAKNLLMLVGLYKRATHRPDELSAGEKQRVAIARALANDPAIIFADEPTGNLDSRRGRQIMELLCNLNKKMGTTIFIVTHDDNMASYAKKKLYLKDGALISMEMENKVRQLSDVIGVPRSLMTELVKSGYDDLDKIMALSRADIEALKKYKDKDIGRIRNCVESYKKKHRYRSGSGG